MGVANGATANFNSGTLGAAGTKELSLYGDGTINVAANTSMTGALNAGGHRRYIESYGCDCRYGSMTGAVGARRA